MPHKNANLMRGCLFVLAAAAVLVACGGGKATLPPSAMTSQYRATNALESIGAKTSLAITLTIGKGAQRAHKLRLYAYPLSSSGPQAAPPPSSLRTSADVGRKSPICQAIQGGRSCGFSATVPVGNDAIVAILTAGKYIFGEAFASVVTSDSTTLALDADDATPASLDVVTPLAVTKRATFNVGVSALTSNGATIILPLQNAIAVRVYGPSGVVPSPAATVGGSGVTAPFRYSGKPFVNAMTVTAVTGTMSATAQVFPSAKEPLACAPLSDTDVFTVPEPTIYPKGFALHASIAGSKPVSVGLDTGSTSFLIAKKKIVALRPSELIGPGQAAQEKLEPSGITIYGNYYLAPVSIYDKDGTHELGRTVPMEVLVATMACDKGKSPPCPPATTAYMGVGFGRPSPAPTSSAGLLPTPLENVFMQLAQIVQGKMHPGFGLSPNLLTIGVNKTAATGFSFTKLDPFPGRPGDWQGPAACLRFDNAGAYQCGHMLLDIGIDSMFITAVTPSPSPDDIEVVAPRAKRASLQYSFGYPVKPQATPPAPTKVDFRTPGPSASIFVNTGRDALAAATYLYDAGCGRVGFKK
jgi:hypothetical protein